jgi:hypothetical protein
MTIDTAAIDIPAAIRFMTAHARILDLRRLVLLADGGDAEPVLAAVDAYRNPDGGYGWGLESDLRSRTSQPGGALHAFEVFEDVAPRRSPRAVELCDWLAAVTLDDGGLPFSFRIDDPDGSAPFWTEADPTVSSLHITAAVAAAGHRVARHDPAVADHPWLDRVTRYCLDEIASRERAGSTLELRFSLNFLDAIAADIPAADDHVARLGAAIPATGTVHVEGGLEDEMMRPLDFAPYPDGPVRALFAPDLVDRELDRLASRQTTDGGWPSEFASYSPAAELEWRGALTVHAITTLSRYGRL